MYHNLQGIGRHFFFQNLRPRLIIQIDVHAFMGFLMGEGGADVFFLKGYHI